MQDADAVRGLERAGDLHCDLEQVQSIQRAVLDPVLQRLPVQQLHHEVGPAAMGSDVVDLANIGMVQGRGGARLTVEAGRYGRRFREILGKELDGDVAIKPGIVGTVDLAHPAAAQQFQHLVVGDCLPLHASFYRGGDERRAFAHHLSIVFFDVSQGGLV